MSARWVVPNILPMAPRPYFDEQMSSWLHRLAAATWLSPSELFGAMQCSKGLPGLEHEDYTMPDEWRSQLAALCRLPVERIISLEHQNRFHEIDHGWYARGWSGRPFWATTLLRPRLPFCVSCCRRQRINGPIYTRAEWCFAFRTHCSIHLQPLIDSCQTCGHIGLPIWSPALFRCSSCDNPLRSSQFIPVSPGLELIVQLQKTILGCIRGRPANSFWIGHTSASDFVDLIAELIHVLLLPWRSCPKYVLADQLAPGDFHRRYNIGRRFDEPRFATLPWFARFKVMAALTQLLLGYRACDFFEEPVPIPSAIQEFFSSIPKEASFGVRRRAAFWPEPLRTMFCTIQEPPPRRNTARRGSSSRPVFKYSIFP